MVVHRKSSRLESYVIKIGERIVSLVGFLGQVDYLVLYALGQLCGAQVFELIQIHSNPLGIRKENLINPGDGHQGRVGVLVACLH